MGKISAKPIMAKTIDCIWTVVLCSNNMGLYGDLSKRKMESYDRKFG